MLTKIECRRLHDSWNKEDMARNIAEDMDDSRTYTRAVACKGAVISNSRYGDSTLEGIYGCDITHCLSDYDVEYFYTRNMVKSSIMNDWYSFSRKDNLN